MKIICRLIPILALQLLFLFCPACAKQEPVSHFVIIPAGGQSQISENETEKLRVTLDAVAARYHMSKWKSGQEGIIRYYQPNSDYEIGFYAKRERATLKVYALPMTPSVAGTEKFRLFRQNLANILSQTFPGQVSLEK